jgi:DNA topoisomerase-2
MSLALRTQSALILTEGDSAKALAVAGLGVQVARRECICVFPLRGKVLNVREAKHG